MYQKKHTTGLTRKNNFALTIYQKSLLCRFRLHQPF